MSYLPDIINYLLTLRYPGSEKERQNWVCYRGFVQYRVPLIWPFQTIAYTVRPLSGTYALLGYDIKFASEMVPDTFIGTIGQFGSRLFSGRVTQIVRENNIEGFVLTTEQEPTQMSVTNISPLAQRGEMVGSGLIISSPQDLATILDALRRLQTSTESEQLLQQAVHLLGILSGEPQEPRPPVGGS